MNLSHNHSYSMKTFVDDVLPPGPVHELETPTLPLPELIAWVEERLPEEDRAAHVQRTRRVGEVGKREAA